MTSVMQMIIESADSTESAIEAIMQTQGITQMDARHVLYHFGDKEHGYSGGDFDTYFLKAMSHADGEHMVRCIAAFPGLGNAFLIAAHMDEGMDLLVKIAEAPL
jgi:hypothetical protein